MIVCVLLLGACAHSQTSSAPATQQTVAAAAQTTAAGATTAASAPAQATANPVSAPGCGTYCQQAGNSAGNSVPGYPCPQAGCQSCPPQNCVTLGSDSSVAVNGVATVQLTCNLQTECQGAVLICLPDGALCESGPTSGGGGGRLGGSDFSLPAGTSAGVAVGLTALGTQLASSPGIEAGIFVDLLDYGGVIDNTSTTGNFALTTTDPPIFPPGATTHCGGTVFAGPNTSCPFAENVANVYGNGFGNVSVVATSPVTGQTYTMQCTGDSPVSCTGGNNALVVFYT
jgi:hypothetical protein